MKVYLDNCCFNRPFDDLSQTIVNYEATAKMYIQSLVKYKSLALCTSYMLLFEVNESPFENSKEHILQFINDYSYYFVNHDKESEIIPLSNNIIKTGIKIKDAVHLACSIIAECDYFISTDKRLTKHKTNEIKIVNPIDFIKIWREQND
jgi:predicted nucleic acid-binding protein